MKKFLCLISLLVLAGVSYASYDFAFHYNGEFFDARVDSILPMRVELPSALSKMETPTNRFNPVYGHIMEHKSIFYRANDAFGDRCQFRDEYNQCVSVMPSIEEFVSVNKPELTDKERFLIDRADKIMQRNDSLFRKAELKVKKEYNYLAGIAQTVGLHEIKIYVEYYYDSTEKKWTRPSAENSIVSMIMVTKWGYFLHQDDDSTISIRNYMHHIPEAETKRLFFDDGYSQVVSGKPEELPLDSVKVILYKLVIQVPQNKNIEYRLKLKEALTNKDYAAVPDILKKMERYSEKDVFFRPALDMNSLDMIDILLQDYSDTDKNGKVYSSEILDLYDDQLEEFISQIFEEYVQSGEFKKALSKEKNPVKRAVANIVVNRVSGGRGWAIDERQSDIVLAYLDSVPNQEQKEFLVEKYWSRMEMHPFYIYFSEMLGGTRYMGRLGDRIRPAFGGGGSFGGGNNVMSLDFFLQGFFWGASYKEKAASSKCFKNRNVNDYEFDVLDIGVDLTYKWLVTRHFEGGIYAGPTFNMSEVVKTEWDNEAPRDENEPSMEIAPGLDVGLSFALFTAFSRRDVERMHGASMYKGGRFGGRLRIGMSTQKAKDSFDVWGWKAYMTLEGTIRAHLATRKKPFLWK